MMPSQRECLRCLGFLSEENKAESLDYAGTFLKLCIRAASARSWSMAIWSELPPFKWAGVVHQDSSLRDEALQSMKEDCDAVSDAKLHIERKGPQTQALCKGQN